MSNPTNSSTQDTTRQASSYNEGYEGYERGENLDDDSNHNYQTYISSPVGNTPVNSGYQSDDFYRNIQPTVPTGSNILPTDRMSDSVDGNGQSDSSHSSYSGDQSNNNYGGSFANNSSNYPSFYGSENTYEHSYENDQYENEMKGTYADDVLTGISVNNNLKGGKGNDRLVGNIGRDKVEGGKGNDWLEGGEGNDYLDGGQGQDILISGGGSDQFVLKSKYASFDPNSADIINDFQKGFDHIVLKDGLGVANLNITQGTGLYANDTILNITETGQVLAVLKNVNSTTINGSDFLLG